MLYVFFPASWSFEKCYGKIEHIVATRISHWTIQSAQYICVVNIS